LPPPSSSAKVSGDFLRASAQTHQWVFGAFAELIHNAFDAGADTIKIQEPPAWRHRQILQVSDNGQGMTFDEMQRMMTFGNLTEVRKKRLCFFILS